MATRAPRGTRLIARAFTRAAIRTMTLTLALLWSASANAEIGIAQFRVGDPAGSDLAWTLFYPAETGSATTEIGPYSVSGRIGAGMKDGRFPLIVISHGSGAGMLSHHDTASYLAINGFVVAAVEHAGDNYRDASGLGRISTAFRRAREVSQVIDAVLDGAYGHAIDRDRIGVIGYSTGTVTALLLAGAEADFSALADYCVGTDNPSALCAGGGRRVADAPQTGSTRDARIDAILLLAPIATMFGGEMIELTTPVGIIAAGADEQLPAADHANVLSRMIKPLTLFEAIPLAGHHIFLAPCSAELKASKPDICTDPPLVDRQREHALLNSLIVSFFNHALASNPQLVARIR